MRQIASSGTSEGVGVAAEPYPLRVIWAARPAPSTIETARDELARRVRKKIGNVGGFDGASSRGVRPRQ